MWYVLNISSDMLLRSWPRMRRWVRIKKDGWREEGLQGTEEELLDRHARYAGTKEVCTKYMNRIKEDHPSIHEYIMDWGDSQFFYTHDQPHFSYPGHYQSLFINESLNGRMRLKTDIEESIRDSNCYNIIHRFIVLALTLSTRRLECWIVSIFDQIPNPDQAKFHHPTPLGVSISAVLFLE